MSNSTPDTNPALWHHHRLKLRTTLGALALDIDLDLTRNWTVIFGPSGSGKSTILRALAGLLPDTEANLIRTNEDRNKHDLTHPRHATAASPTLRSSPRSSLTSPSRTTSPSHRDRHVLQCLPRENINDAIKLFRLEDLVHRYPKNLSGGERQRVNLARAFAMPDAQLMLLDEPFNGIDRPLRDAILPELRESLRLSGVPVVSVTHDVEEAFRLQAEVVILRDGRIHDEGYVSKVLHEERLSILDALR